MSKRKPIDWVRIQKDYRLGQKSIRNIASEHGVSHQAISKRKKKEGWVQDKSKEVHEKTRAALIGCQDEVAKKVATPSREEIDLEVQTRVQVVLSHRKDIKRGRDICVTLLSQLRDVADFRAELEDAITEETKGDTDAKGNPSFKRRNAMFKAIALPSNASTLRDLSMVMKNLQGLERIAFNLDAEPEDPDTVKSRMTPERKEILLRAARIVSQEIIEIEISKAEKGGG